MNKMIEMLICKQNFSFLQHILFSLQRTFPRLTLGQVKCASCEVHIV